MQSNTAVARAEINVCLFLIVVCCVVLWESRLIPPGSFEPLGSGPVPQATAGLIILMCLWTIVRAFRTIRLATNEASQKHPDSDFEQDDHKPRHVDALVVCALTVIYALVLHTKKVDFALATVVFLFLCIGFLVRFKPKSMLFVSLIAVLMGYGCQYLFTRVFVVDLPGAF